MLKKTIAGPILGATSLLLAACPSEPTQTQPTQPPPVVTARPTEANDAIEMSPVETPKSLVLVMRAPRPKETLDAIQKVGKIPFSLEKALSDASKGASNYFDLTDSFDLAVGLDPETTEIDHPKFFVAFSLPLQKDNYEPLLDIMEKDGDQVHKAGPGYYRIQARDLTCELVAPANVVPRIVCGQTTTAFRELGPWMYRSLATQAKPSNDVSLRVQFGPVRDQFLPLLKRELDEGLGSARKGLGSLGVNDAELLDVPSTAAKELTAFIDELDRMEASATINPSKPDAVLKAELFFRGNQSWMTKVLTSSNAPAAPAPDVFWRLPKDSEFALYGHSADPALFTGIRRVAKKGLVIGLQFAHLEKADNDAIVALLDALPSSKGTWTFASGDLAPLKGGANPSDKPDAFKPDNAIVEMKNKIRSIARWSVIGQEGDVNQMVSFLKQANDVYARGVKYFKKQADDKVKKATGDGKKWATESRKKLDDAPRVKFIANPPGFPKGSAALDIDFTFSSKDVWNETHPVREFDRRPKHPANETKGTMTIRVAVVPDEGGRYVWGFSADPDALKDKLLAALKTGKPDAQLASRTDLGKLKGSLQTGGFIAIGQFIRAVAKIDSHDRDARKLVELLDALPNKGSSPIFLIGGGQGGATPSLSTELVLDKGWMDDLGGLFTVMGRKRQAAP